METTTSPLFVLFIVSRLLFCIFSAWPIHISLLSVAKQIKELKGSRKQGRHGHGVKLLLKLLVLVRVWRNPSGVMLLTQAIRLSNVLCFVDPLFCGCDCLCQQGYQEGLFLILLAGLSSSRANESSGQQAADAYRIIFPEPKIEDLRIAPTSSASSWAINC